MTPPRITNVLRGESVQLFSPQGRGRTHFRQTISSRSAWCLAPRGFQLLLQETRPEVMRAPQPKEKTKKQNKTSVGEGGFGGAQIHQSCRRSSVLQQRSQVTVQPPAQESSHRPIRSHLKLSLVRQAVQSFVSAWANSFFGLLNRQIEEGIKVWENEAATVTL